MGDPREENGDCDDGEHQPDPKVWVEREEVDFPRVRLLSPAGQKSRRASFRNDDGLHLVKLPEKNGMKLFKLCM